MHNPNYKAIVCMHFTCIARYRAILTCKLKYGHNFWTDRPIFKIFSDTWSEYVLQFTTETSMSIALTLKDISHFKILIMQYLEN